MQRIGRLLLCLALCCALSACAKPAPAPTTAEGTTTATPKESTVFEPTSGEENGIAWRALDSESKAVKDFTQAWFHDYYNPKPRDGVALSGIVKVSEKPTGKYGAREIWMRDEATGKETLLLGFDEENSLIPCLIDAVDSRYFLFLRAIMDSDGFGWPMLYDTQEKREIEIQYPDGGGNYVQTANGKLYFVYASGGLGTGGGVGLHVLCAELSALEKGESLAANDVLKGMPAYDALLEVMPDYDAHYALSPDARYFAIFVDNGSPVLHVFDITRRELAFILELPQALGDNLRLAFLDAHTLYWFGDQNIIEITLP